MAMQGVRLMGAKVKKLADAVRQLSSAPMASTSTPNAAAGD